MAAAALLQAPIPKLCATDMPRGVRLLPALPGRDRGPQGNARLLHHAGRERHGRAYPDRRLAKLRRGVMELYISDHPLDCLTCTRQRRLRVADAGRRRRPARRALRLRGRQSSTSAEGRVESLFHLRSLEVHRLLALRARLRGGAGHVRADRSRARLRARKSRRAASISCRRNASPAAPACRPARPRRSTRRASSQHGKAGARGRHHLRLLRRRLLVQGGDQGRQRSCAWSPTRPARPTRAIPASRAASPMATPRTRTASSSR